MKTKNREELIDNLTDVLRKNKEVFGRAVEVCDFSNEELQDMINAQKKLDYTLKGSFVSLAVGTTLLGSAVTLLALGDKGAFSQNMAMAGIACIGAGLAFGMPADNKLVDTELHVYEVAERRRAEKSFAPRLN